MIALIKIVRWNTWTKDIPVFSDIAKKRMEWDKFRIAQKFLQKANAIHPEDAEVGDAHDELLAVQEVYYDCYMSSFSREDLLKRLEEVVNGKFEIPEGEEVDEGKYRAAYIREAKIILASIHRGEV